MMDRPSDAGGETGLLLAIPAQSATLVDMHRN
jgi:hypothetical protein